MVDLIYSSINYVYYNYQSYAIAKVIVSIEIIYIILNAPI